MPGAPGDKVRVVPFAVNLLLASKGGDQNYTWFELNLDECEDWGPYIQSITAHTDTRAPSAQARWTVGFYWGVDGKVWNPTGDAITLFAATGTAGQAIQAAYTTTTNFGLKLRFVVGIKANAGTAVETATVSGALAFEFRS